MAASRFRLQVKFWLDLHKPEEHNLAELIAELKEQRAFSGAVRDGIRLVADLCRGNLDVLLALFPWVEEALYERFRERQTVSDFALAQQLERLERLLLAHEQPASAVRSGAPKPLAVPVLPGPPVEDEEDVHIISTRKTSTSGDASRNFLDSVMRLQQ